MEISFGNIILVLAIVLTGMTSGLCFTWGNAVTPGIGNLDDLAYLRSFQQMNRSILNPTFFVVFFGPVFMSFLSAFANKSGYGSVFWLSLIAATIYLIGVALVTIFGNVPLNEILDRTNLLNSGTEELKNLRKQFEEPWNRFHGIRTITSTIAFGLLAIAAIIK
ncbi:MULTISPECIES: DUF1772 domain-containing protein [Flavobacteriaceae]|uniref:anthrone oxygenase family protein n=1 Tax=Flavobacteriaceae TaxID=49546 RepID=UPI001490D496|nr:MULTISPECIES: DUF1772 domain-containing protein [Allomuricauda]MDC6365705.1 DUF1772 domain-containing protein [Muricauda sp. AC10]